MNSLKPIDDVAIQCTDQDDLAEILKNALDRARELATQHKFLPPILAVLTDAEARCLLTMIMNFDEPGWTGQTAPGEFDKRSGIAFPWFLVVEDGEGKKVRICIENRSASEPA